MKDRFWTVFWIACCFIILVLFGILDHEKHEQRCAKREEAAYRLGQQDWNCHTQAQKRAVDYRESAVRLRSKGESEAAQLYEDLAKKTLESCVTSLPAEEKP